MAILRRNKKAQIEPTLTREAAISKQELAVVAAQYGAGNMAKFEGFEPNSLRLLTFKGSWDAKQRKFVGQYHFASGGSWLQGEVERMTDFNKLPGIAAPERAAKPAGKVKSTTQETLDVADV